MELSYAVLNFSMVQMAECAECGDEGMMMKMSVQDDNKIQKWRNDDDEKFCDNYNHDDRDRHL